MTALPVISGEDCIRALLRAGFHRRRQSGSHVFVERVDPYAAVSVPLHRELRPGTLRSIIRDTDLTVEQFVELLRG